LIFLLTLFGFCPISSRSTTITHKFDVSGQCRSVDHETSIEAIACDREHGAVLEIHLKRGVSALPASWQVGTVLVGSAEWQCAHAGAPTGHGHRSELIEGRFEPMVRRIVAIERRGDADNVFTLTTQPELATVCLNHATVTFRNHLPETMSVEQYMRAFETIVYADDDRKRAAAGANDTDMPSGVDYRRTFNLASVDVNWNRFSNANPALTKAMAWPADFNGVRLRCLECFMKLAVGVDITIKGQRVEPSSEWKWDLWRVKAFGKMSMALHLSVDLDIFENYRPALWLRASVLRMMDSEYFTNPHARLPVLSYLGITLLSVQLKMDLTAAVELALSASFRFSTGFRVTDASLELGFEKIGDGEPQMIRSANFDGELIPFDFVLNDGNEGSATAGFGPHLMVWPWITGTGVVQKALSWISKVAGKDGVSVPLFIFNVHPVVQIASRFKYGDDLKCVYAQGEFGFSIVRWFEMTALDNEPVNFNSPARGITMGYASNFVKEHKLWTVPLGGRKCLFSLDLGSLAVGGVCDALEKKCKDRCAARATAARPTVTVTRCHCASGSLLQQCSDEEEPFLLHPEGGVGGVLRNDSSAATGADAFSQRGEAAPRLDIAALLPLCGAQLTCDDCAKQRQCGWCGSVGRCLPGDIDEKPAACHGDDWLYDSCFRNPKLQITNVVADQVLRAGDVVPLKWTSRLDVAIARVGVAYRWQTDASWVLAAVVVASAKAYALRLPDGLPSTSSFQFMIMQMPDGTPLGEDNVESLPVTPENLAAFGRAYATSPLVTVRAPLACTGISGEAGSCLTPASCTAIKGTLLYKGRRNEREGCDQGELASSTLQCCSVGTQKRAVAAPRVVVGLYGACPACANAADNITARRSVYCLEGGSQTPRELAGPSDACAGLPLPAFEKPCGQLPVCKTLPIKFVRPSVSFSVDTHVAVAGQPFSVSWEGGRLNVDAQLQVLLGSDCAAATTSSIDAMPWKTVATAKAYTGNNAVNWNVPSDFVRSGAPQWVRLRLVIGDATALSASVLVAAPAEVALVVNGAPLPTTAVPVLGDKPADGSAVLTPSATMPANVDRIWGSVRLLGSGSQLLLEFTGRSQRNAAFDVGTVSALQLQLSDAAAGDALQSLAVRLADGSTLTVQAPFATSTYACTGAGLCTIDATDAALRKATAALPREQRCLLSEKFEALANPSAAASTQAPVSGEGEGEGEDAAPGDLEIALIVIGSAVLLFACIIGLVCVIKRRKDVSHN
jgi:hypothetical protein